MKNKFFKKKIETDLEEDDIADETAVSSTGPSIATLKNSKLALVAASSVLITLVVYFIFFKGEEEKPQLEEVKPQIINPVNVVHEGKSPFELEEAKPKPVEDVDILEKPKTPDVPKLPELPGDKDISNLLMEPERPSQDQQQPPQLPAVAPPNQIPTTPQPQQPTTTAQPVQQVQTQNGSISDPRYAPIVVLSGGPGPARSVGYDNNLTMLNGDPIRALEKSKINVKTTFVDNRNNVVAQGKIINAVLETAINTESPGAVRAVVSRDVYAEVGNEILISRGSRLFGTYSSEIVRGQGRVQIVWSRLIRNDGVDLAISSLASDQFGRAGIAGEIDSKYAAVITNSLLTSILAVGGVAIAEKILGNDGQTTTTVNPQQGTATTTGAASTQAVYNASKTITDTVSKIVNDNVSVNPIIRVPQGTKVTVIVNADMNIPSMRKK